MLLTYKEVAIMTVECRRPANIPNVGKGFKGKGIQEWTLITLQSTPTIDDNAIPTFNKLG